MTYRSYYDTVILGAGLGGLVTGAILARGGSKVLVLEEKSYPGGVCTIAHPDGYTFVRGPALLLGLEKDGYCDQLFSELGLSLAMLKRAGGLLKRPAPFLQIVTERYRINLEVSRGEQLAEYKREWGGTVGAFQQFYRDLDVLDGLVYPFFYKKHLPGSAMPLWDRLRKIRQGLRRRWMTHVHSNLSSQKYLSRYPLPQDFLKALEFLSLLWCGSSLGQNSALELLIQQALSSREVIRPVGGMVKLCEVLAKIFLENRGEIRYQQGVTSMRRESRTDWAITLMSGEEFHTRQLVVHLPWELLVPKDYGMLTFFFALDAQVVPSSKSEQLILYRTRGHSEEQSLRLEDLLFIVMSLSEEERAYEKKRLMMVSALFPHGSPPTEPAVRQLLHGVIKQLHWLMPFSEGKIQYVGNDEPDRQAQAQRMAKARPFLKHLRHIRRRHIEYAYPRFDQGLFFLPDHGSGMGMLSTEVRSAEEIAKRIIKCR